MLIHFHLHYKTSLGEQLGIEYILSNDNTSQIASFITYDGENWTFDLDTAPKTTIGYKYVILKNNQIAYREWGKPRSLYTASKREIFVEDGWRARNLESNAYLSTAFTEAICKRPDTKEKKQTATSQNVITFRLHSASIPSGCSYGITGNIPELGLWTQPILLLDQDFPTWEVSIPLTTNNLFIEYKYVICDLQSGQIIHWESGENRRRQFILPIGQNQQLVFSDDLFRNYDGAWRGSGVAIPVFSLRSDNGLGIGEYTDVHSLVSWSKKVGMNVIQILPVNDTIATKTWADSYPYAAISVFALHPLYINLQSIAALKIKKDAELLITLTHELNALEQVDFERVLEHKFYFLRILFNQEYKAFIKEKAFITFMDQNQSWLQPYAAFCHLRDIYKTANFNNWPKYSSFSQEVIDILCNPSYEAYEEIAFYYFIQYHADKQLMSAKMFARQEGVVLKGDLPIGIYRHSCDAWVAPDLYNMNEQAGAPPDDYAVLGQNWGFPTYNWSVMDKNGFRWWRKRMQQLNRYFDAMRIDHILGFFRIWQIPTDQVEGTMGMFNPRLPISINELANYGIYGDLTRFTKPYLTYDLLYQMFGSELEEVAEMFFSKSNDGKIFFKTSFDTQQEIRQFITQNEQYKKHEKNLLLLISDVLLLEEPNSKGQQFNPRITLNTTHSYNSLDYQTKASFDALYSDYYYKRHDEYWKQQALWKLPAILDASDMLICGEDLGMIPKAVPGVMKDMNIISLEIQRMPKGNSQFGLVQSYPYFSVCSPSCHDMSTIRGWWEGDHENAKEYYYKYLHGEGFAPIDCTPEIVQAIVLDHMKSPSMLAIFPIQDLVGMMGHLRKNNAASEQINEPSNPKHYWRFRFHMSVKELLAAEDLNTLISSMVAMGNR